MIQQPFKLICHCLLHHLDDNSLLDFLNNVLGQSYSQRRLQQLAATDVPESVVGRSLWASQQLEHCLHLLVFGCVTWQDLNSLSTTVALAFHYPQLQRAFQAFDEHQVVFWLEAAVYVTCQLLLAVLSSFAAYAPLVLMQSEQQFAIRQM